MEESLTDKDSVDSGASDALPEEQNNPSADEQTQDSVSSDDKQDADPSNNQQVDEPTTEEDSSSNDDGLAKFAKSQGFDPDNLTEGERKALKLAHDNQKSFRQASQRKTEELSKTVKEVNEISQDELDDMDPTEARLAQVEAFQRIQAQELRTTKFYADNPEAREYDKEMAQILADEIKSYSNPEEGKAAARYLGRDLNRLLELAKIRRGDPTEEARRRGAREERENLRKRQEGSADGMQATQPTRRGNKITREDILSMSDEEFEKLGSSGELDAIISRGDLY